LIVALITGSASAGEDGKIIAGALLGAIIGGAIVNHNQNRQPQYAPAPAYAPQPQYVPQHNPYNSPQQPSYTQGYSDPRSACNQTHERRRDATVVRTYNCFGQLLGEEYIPRH
jgi:hypothetical protein